MTNAYHLFEQGAELGSTFIQDASGNALYSYSELDALTAGYATMLGNNGIKPGDRVMVQAEKSPESLLLYFACMRAGCIYLPLNTAYKTDELAYFIDNATPSLIICDPRSETQFGQLSNAPVLTMDTSGGGSLVDELPDLSTSGRMNYRTVERDSDDVAVIIYTSGTTGQPKGAMITHGNIETNSRTLSQAWGWQASDVMLHALPVYHVHGLFVGSHLPVMNGSAITFLGKFDAEQIISLLPSSTVYMGVPTNYTRLLASPSLTREACSNMRLFTSGSAPLLSQTFEEFQQRTGHTIVERYGMSETGMNTSNPLQGTRKAGTVGPPLAGVKCRVVDDAGKPQMPGTTGHLELTGPNVFKGYWRMPEKTAAEFSSDGFFRTGDLALIDDDGYVSIVGRNKDLIITGGLNVYPKEIETVIDGIPGVMESAVIGVHDADFGEAVTGVVVRDHEFKLSEADVIAHLKDRLANFKVTKRVFFVDELPRNAMGKVQKNVLREQFNNVASQEVSQTS
jgi:malonyl-CoA/methylmalonyl-CoA synthetase